MIVTQSDARKIIKAAYGPDLTFRLTTQCQVAVRQIYDPRPSLAWRKLLPGDSAVCIGCVLPSGDIDWDYQPHY